MSLENVPVTNKTPADGMTDVDFNNIGKNLNELESSKAEQSSNNNFQAGNSTFKDVDCEDITASSLDSSGPVSGTTGSFSGAVSGTTGSFSGAVTGTSYSGGPVSGTTGSFTGGVSGLTGSFTNGAQAGGTGIIKWKPLEATPGSLSVAHGLNKNNVIGVACGWLEDVSGDFEASSGYFSTVTVGTTNLTVVLAGTPVSGTLKAVIFYV